MPKYPRNRYYTINGFSHIRVGNKPAWHTMCQVVWPGCRFTDDSLGIHVQPLKTDLIVGWWHTRRGFAVMGAPVWTTNWPQGYIRVVPGACHVTEIGYGRWQIGAHRVTQVV